MANPRSTARIAGHPIHPMLVPFPIAFLAGTLVADIVYLATTDVFWATASFWLLVGALFMAALAAIMGFIDFFGDARIREGGTAWAHMIGNLIVVVLSLINLWMRLGGPTAPYPFAMWLSLLVVAILLFNGWMGWELVYKHRVGIADDSAAPR
jgi:uncharacterized membrane protein